MNKQSPKNKIFSSLVSFVLFLVLFSAMALAANASLEGVKAVNPQVMYVGDNATITLTVTGVGDVYTTTKPVDVMLVIDNSCSMQGTKINDAKAAGNLIIDELIASDRVGMVSFNTNPTLRSQFTSDFSSVRSKINALTVCGNTNVGEAINMAMNQFSGSNVRSMVLISDGNTNLPANAQAYALQKANEAGDKNITIFVIGIGNDVNSNILRSIATAGHGLYFHYPTGNALDGLFDGISHQTSNIAGTNIIVTDVLQSGVIPITLPLQCIYSVSDRRVTCNAGQLNIGESRSFSFNVTVYNSALSHLNVVQYVNYTNYLGTNTYLELNNPLVTILTRSNVCVNDASPVISILSPNNRVYNTSLVTVSINAVDTNLSSVWYNFNGTNISYNSPVILNLSEGNYRLNAYANDSCGNLASDYVNFVVNLSASTIVDNIGPNVTIHSPINNRVYNTRLIGLSITAVDDIAVDKIWYNLNGTNISYLGIRTLNLSEGSYVLSAYANDSSGNIGSDRVSFVVNFSSSNNGNQTNQTNHTSTTTCTHCGNTRAPINDFNTSNGNSISMSNEDVIALNYQMDTAQVNKESKTLTETSGSLIFNMILLIAIVVLLFIIVLIGKKK